MLVDQRIHLPMNTELNPRAQAATSLKRLAALVFQRDPAVLDEFCDDALLVGSERGEMAVGRAELQPFLRQVFDRPTRISWEWDDIRASAAGELCWLFAEGTVVITGLDGEMRAPYRLSGVLRCVAGRWLWQQFHGAEPATSG
jgi:ketosteroid isomerase-like protein